MAALHSRCGHYIFALWFLFLSFFLAYSQPSQIWCLPYIHTWWGLSANLGCRYETCCTWLAENAGCKKSPKIWHVHTIAQLCPAVSSQLRHISTIRKNLLNSNISSTCPHNMVNFDPLMAEISLPVWGTRANFNGFRVLALLLHWHRSSEANQTSQDVWPSPGWYIILVYTFLGALAPWQNFASCKIHFASKSIFLLYWQPYCTALEQWPSAKLWHGTRNGITELSQRAPPIFGCAAITLGIGPHSSWCCIAERLY